MGSLYVMNNGKTGNIYRPLTEHTMYAMRALLIRRAYRVLRYGGSSLSTALTRLGPAYPFGSCWCWLRRIQLMIYLGMLHPYIYNNDVGCQPIIKPRTAYIGAFCCCTSGVPERND